MPETVRLAVNASVDGIGAYPDPSCRELKSALAEKLEISGDHLVIGNGAAELIFLAAQAVKPSAGLIPVPAFQEYEQALRSVDAETNVYHLKPEEDFLLGEDFVGWLEERLSAEAVDTASGGEKEDKMIFLCSPHNPTGQVIDKSILKKIMEISERFDVWLVVDESFGEFAYVSEEETMIPCLKETKKLIILRSFTKMYGIPGLRLGFCACADSVLAEKMESVRQPWSVSVPAQAAGVAILQEKTWAGDVRSYVEEQRIYLEEALQGLGFRVFSSRANFLLFYSDKPLAEHLKKRGILIRDCRNFAGLGEGYYRVAVKREEENHQLIEALAGFGGDVWQNR